MERSFSHHRWPWIGLGVLLSLPINAVLVWAMLQQSVPVPPPVAPRPASLSTARSLPWAGATPTRGLIGFGERQWRACDRPEAAGQPVVIDLEGGPATWDHLMGLGSLSAGGWGVYVEALGTSTSTGLQLHDVLRIQRVERAECPAATPGVEAQVAWGDTVATWMGGVLTVEADTLARLRHSPDSGPPGQTRWVSLSTTTPSDGVRLTLWRAPCLREAQLEVLTVSGELASEGHPPRRVCVALGPLGVDGDRLGALLDPAGGRRPILGAESLSPQASPAAEPPSQR